MRPHHARGLAQSQMLPYFAVFTRKIAQNRSCSVVNGVRRARSSHASSIRVLSYVSPPPEKNSRPVPRPATGVPFATYAQALTNQSGGAAMRAPRSAPRRRRPGGESAELRCIPASVHVALARAARLGLPAGGNTRLTAHLLCATCRPAHWPAAAETRAVARMLVGGGPYAAVLKTAWRLVRGRVSPRSLAVSRCHTSAAEAAARVRE